MRFIKYSLIVSILIGIHFLVLIDQVLGLAVFSGCIAFYIALEKDTDKLSQLFKKSQKLNEEGIKIMKKLQKEKEVSDFIGVNLAMKVSKLTGKNLKEVINDVTEDIKNMSANREITPGEKS